MQLCVSDAEILFDYDEVEDDELTLRVGKTIHNVIQVSKGSMCFLKFFHSFVHSNLCSFIHWFVRSFVHSFICSFFFLLFFASLFHCMQCS